LQFEGGIDPAFCCEGADSSHVLSAFIMRCMSLGITWNGVKALLSEIVIWHQTV
jgi:hypothetical protein